MNLNECCKAVASQITDELVLASLSGTSHTWTDVMPHKGSLYALTMGVACGMGLGLSVALPHRGVVVLEGDGSLLLNLGILTVIAESKPSNLTIIITDNECYDAVGEHHPTPTASVTNLEAAATGCGIHNTATVRDASQVRLALARALKEPGPWFIVAKVERGYATGAVRSTSKPDMLENKYQFVRYVEGTENIQILI